jgi:hypothetical protein
VRKGSHGLKQKLAEDQLLQRTPSARESQSLRSEVPQDHRSSAISFQQQRVQARELSNMRLALWHARCWAWRPMHLLMHEIENSMLLAHRSFLPVASSKIWYDQRYRTYVELESLQFSGIDYLILSKPHHPFIRESCHQKQFTTRAQ